MEILATAGGLASAALAITVAVLALRLSGAKTEAADADRAKKVATSKLKETARELLSTKERSSRQLADLRKDIGALEEDLANCSSPGAARSRLERLLSKAADRADGDNSPGVPG
jgi:chromosome segregation ATPase